MTFIFYMYIYICIYLDWWLVEVDLIELGWSVKDCLPSFCCRCWGEKSAPQGASALSGGRPPPKPIMNQFNNWRRLRRKSVEEVYQKKSQLEHWTQKLDVLCDMELVPGSICWIFFVGLSSPALKIHGNKKTSAWAQAYPPTTWLLCCSPS